MELESLDQVCQEVFAEVVSATQKYGSMKSGHEGYAVILEELDELKAEVWKRSPANDDLHKEAIQVAAMAVRFVIDVCGG